MAAATCALMAPCQHKSTLSTGNNTVQVYIHHRVVSLTMAVCPVCSQVHYTWPVNMVVLSASPSDAP